MNDPKSFFSQFCNCDLLKSSGRQCKPGQKSFVGNLIDELSEKYGNKNVKKDCPDPSKIEECIETNKPSKPQCCDETKKKSDKTPCKLEKLPTTCNACYIKEQNPLAPPCCRLKSEPVNDDTPCPPDCHQDYRAPICSCDFCRKNGFHGNCCDRRSYPDENSPRLEKA